MSSKTKIVVLHMKEIVSTAVFIILGILLLILFSFMFFPKKEKPASNQSEYIPGIYTSAVNINDTQLQIEVSVDSSHINAISFSNLEESVSVMYPLIQPSIEYIAEQIYETQSLENIQLSEDSPYTSQLILRAIEQALTKAEASQ